MVSTYNLPWAGASRVFTGWNQMDPPDDRELTRHQLVTNIQGNSNSFVLDPSLIEQL
jgi:deoxyribonuclease-1